MSIIQHIIDDDAEDIERDEFLDELEEPPKAPPSEFAIQLRPRAENILSVLVDKELIEFEDDKREAVIEDMTEAAENARNPKAILKAIMYSLIKSDNVEEIYGSNSELLTHIEKAIAIR